MAHDYPLPGVREEGGGAVTLEERAEQLLQTLGCPWLLEDRRRVAGAIREAVEEEREACAQMAEEHPCCFLWERIRARGDKR